MFPGLLKSAIFLCFAGLCSFLVALRLVGARVALSLLLRRWTRAEILRLLGFGNPIPIAKVAFPRNHDGERRDLVRTRKSAAVVPRDERGLGL